MDNEILLDRIESLSAELENESVFYTQLLMLMDGKVDKVVVPAWGRNADIKSAVLERVKKLMDSVPHW